MLSALLLIAELVIFLIKVAIYTMVGLILNSSHAMQYVSTSSLAWLYYRRCFGGIGKIYKTYNKAVQTILYRISKQQVDETARKNKKEHEKTTLKVIHESSQGEDSDPIVGTYEHDETSEMDTRLSSDKSVHITPENDEYIIPSDQIGGGKEHKPKSERNANDRVLNFKTNGVILLLDQSDKQYITKQFFFKVCKIKPDGPGPWGKHFLVALRQFLIIFIFLVFVTLVVLAFGESYRVSFPNQLLATLAGGVVPWILMKTNLLFSQDGMPDAEELVERYFDDDLIMENEGNGSNDKPLQHAQSTRLNKNGEVIVKGIFKKNFDKVIEKHEEWWTIGDMDFAGKLGETTVSECVHEQRRADIQKVSTQ
ncbi:Hypothetical predicted protein [Mytilus galloprovincialis]|uniref:Uncharacterized protein n=1 Tax=Mytilus galloprovincialis TaxID=29158 RepID=A0A8B6CAY1_MYTGA|nr:Hypothetical predicted protein [Mytilus galloprovincialis]